MADSADGAALPPAGFLGLTLHWRQLGGGALVSDNLYSPLTRLPAHAHERAYVAFVLQGCFQELCGRESIECTAGTVLLHPAEEIHADAFTSRGGRVFSVELDLAEGGELGRVYPGRQVIRGGPVFRLGLGLCLRLAGGDGLADLHVEEFAHSLGAELCHLRRLPDRMARSAWMGRAKDFLHAHFAEPLSLAAIARNAGVHPVHLARQFRRTHGCTVGDFIRSLRVQRALELLLDSEQPISRIAADCGFADQSHLTRRLKSLTGASPGRLRDRLRS